MDNGSRSYHAGFNGSYFPAGGDHAAYQLGCQHRQQNEANRARGGGGGGGGGKRSKLGPWIVLGLFVFVAWNGCDPRHPPEDAWRVFLHGK